MVGVFWLYSTPLFWKAQCREAKCGDMVVFCNIDLVHFFNGFNEMASDILYSTGRVANIYKTTSSKCIHLM